LVDLLATSVSTLSRIFITNVIEQELLSDVGKPAKRGKARLLGKVTNLALLFGQGCFLV
jgi:hypothetical protein